MSADAADQIAQLKLDALEADAPGELGEGGRDDEYEFEADFDDDEDAAPRTRRGGGGATDSRGARQKAKRAKMQGPAPHVARALGHRRPQRLADMLLADGIGTDSPSKGGAAAQASSASSSASAAAGPGTDKAADGRPVVVILGRRPTTAADAARAGIDFLSAGKCSVSSRPRRRFCGVTGLPALHREPRTRKRFAGKAEHARLVDGSG